MMMANCTLLIKTLVKCSMDNYVLPGTTSGTEILWIYLIQWKRDLATLAFASIYFLGSQLEFKSSSFEREASAAHINPVERK